MYVGDTVGAIDGILDGDELGKGVAHPGALADRPLGQISLPVVTCLQIAPSIPFNPSLLLEYSSINVAPVIATLDISSPRRPLFQSPFQG